MSEITASMVKELREMTGLGMMECKKALVESKGDIKAAEEQLRIKSGAKASKAASRVTAEGVVSTFIANDGKTGALVEVNCETDFVAKNDDFVAFAKNAAETVAKNNPADNAALSGMAIANGSGFMGPGCSLQEMVGREPGVAVSLGFDGCPYTFPARPWRIPHREPPSLVATRPPSRGVGLLSPMPLGPWGMEATGSLPTPKGRQGAGREGRFTPRWIDACGRT